MFATLLVTGAVETFSDMVAISLTVFTGAGAIAVLYSASENAQDAKRMVRQAAPFLVAGALAVSLVAPIFEQLFFIERLRYAAGLALLVIAMNMGGIDLADKLSVPAILLTGVVLSIKNPGSLVLSLEYVFPALATSAIALLALYGASRLDVSRMNLNYINNAGAIVLAGIALSMYGFTIPSEFGLAVFAIAVAASYQG